MNALPQQIIAGQKASLGNLLAFQGAMLDGFEKLVDLNLKVLKTSFDEVSKKSQQAAQLQDVQEALAFSASLFQPNADQAVAYGKNVYELISGVQGTVTKITEAQLAQVQQQLQDAIEQLSKNAPAGSEGAVALLKSSLATANSAYEAMAKSARQAAEVAESNISAATDATLKAASDAAQATQAATGTRARRAAA
ncbi:MAG: phasin family protein [Castellaniella sp.]